MSLNVMADHLWQSTLFAGFAGLLTLALRKNPARARHWIWFAASVKFLIPFSLFIALGSQIEWRTASKTVSYIVPAIADQVSEPFTASMACVSRSNTSERKRAPHDSIADLAVRSNRHQLLVVGPLATHSGRGPCGIASNSRYPDKRDVFSHAS
jgi:hypothetical protein